MAFANDAMKMLDLPHAFQEVVKYLAANSAAGSCIDGDDDRYIYVLLSGTSFWRYDTWTNTKQQLANPTGTFGAGTCIRYTKHFGTQLNGIVYGSVFAIVTSGTGAPVFTRYDIANNTWTVLNVTNLTATYGTDASLIFPGPNMNNLEAYHSGVLRTITATANAIVGATSISVSALPQALPSGTILNFGTLAAPKYAVLTASAAAAAVSITVAPLQVQVDSTNTSAYYDNMYLVGNASTQMYRFAIATAAWSTTSANSGNPALPALPGAVGAGCSIRWAPGMSGYTDKLVIIRGAGTNSIYVYDFVANNIVTLTYTPNTETFTTGTSSGVAINPTTNKASRILISSSNFLNSNVRILELNPVTGRMDMVTSLTLITSGAAVVGDKLTLMESPDGVICAYQLLHTSNALVRDLSISALT